MIPLVDLAAQYRQIKDEIDAAVSGVFESGQFILGPNVAAFEAEVATFLGLEHAVGVASGTDALVIALRTAGVQPGDEVIIPAYSFFATAGAVLTIGARPVFVDVEPGTYLIDAEQVESAITGRTRAIVPVHLYGQPAEMDTILAMAEERGLAVIEDNAQAFGAEYQGRKAGSLGDSGCLSFYPTKILGAYGDGGMLVTDDADMAAAARKLRTHGWGKKYFPEMLGYNSRLDELQAAILRVKLRHLSEWTARRQALAEMYTAALAGLDLELPQAAQGRTHIYFVYVVGSDARDNLQQRLAESGIASEIYFPQALHLAKPCRSLGYRAGQFPVAEAASRRLLALPFYPELSDAQVDEVCTAVKHAVERP